jgi:hypothetical protein
MHYKILYRLVKLAYIFYILTNALYAILACTREIQFCFYLGSARTFYLALLSKFLLVMYWQQADMLAAGQFIMNSKLKQGL